MKKVTSVQQHYKLRSILVSLPSYDSCVMKALKVVLLLCSLTPISPRRGMPSPTIDGEEGGWGFVGWGKVMDSVWLQLAKLTSVYLRNREIVIKMNHTAGLPGLYTVTWLILQKLRHPTEVTTSSRKEFYKWVLRLLKENSIEMSCFSNYKT